MLLPENIEVWNLWAKVNTQWRVGFSLVGLDYTAVLQVAAVYAITVTPELLDKIRILEHDTLQSLTEEYHGKKSEHQNRDKRR